jgi:hypothetical protein
MPNPSTLELLNLYKDLFGTYMNKENPHDLKAKTNNFYVYLKKSEKELKLLKEDMREVAAAKRAFSDTLSKSPFKDRCVQHDHVAGVRKGRLHRIRQPTARIPDLHELC